MDPPAHGARSGQPELPVGSRVHIAIRPEDVAVEEGDGPGTGIVERSTFLGTLGDHVIAVTGAGPAAPPRLRAQSLGSRLDPVGSVVRIELDGARCALVG